MIEVTSFYGVHQGGTKDYTLMLVKSKKTGKAIIIKQYGKKGRDGTIKIDLAKGWGEEDLNKALREREKRGYDMRTGFGPHVPPMSQHKMELPSVADILSLLPGRHRTALTLNMAKLLDPDVKLDPFAEERKEAYPEVYEAERERRREAEAAKQQKDDEERRVASSQPFSGVF